MAIMYGALGESNEGFAWLEKAYEERDPQLTYLKAGRRFEPQREDPRFKQLLRRVGLPDFGGCEGTRCYRIVNEQGHLPASFRPDRGSGSVNWLYRRAFVDSAPVVGNSEIEGSGQLVKNLSWT